MGKLKVGLVSIWFRRGQTYLALMCRKALVQAGHDVYVLGRKGQLSTPQGVFAMEDGRDELKVDRFISYPTYIIQPNDFKKFVTDNNLDVVICMEEQWQKNMPLADVCNELNVPIVNIPMWEVFNPDEKEFYNKFDLLLFPIKCAYQKSIEHGYKNSCHVQWGVDMDLWNGERLYRENDTTMRFIHSSGWGGAYGRKQTDILIEMFLELGDLDVTLLIHKQHPNDDGQVIKEKIGKNIILYTGNMAHANLKNFYMRSDMAIIFEKFSGLSFNCLEPLALGVPVMTLDVSPMNEWITDGFTGILCKVDKYETYSNIDVPAAIVDKQDALEKIRDVVQNKEKHTAKHITKNIKTIVKTRLNWAMHGKHFVQVIQSVVVNKKVGAR